jgi:methionine sulfoxide reductase heme-binding subunit
MAIARNTILKPIVFLACLAPFLQLVVGTLQQVYGTTSPLGANPVERITHQTGLSTLVLLLITLSITPVRKIFGALWLIQYRRMIGLFAFFYGCLHLMTYLVLDQSFNFGAMAHDLSKRPFIFAGTFSFLLMVPLAVTSTKGWIRRLGKRWQKLHRIVYISAAAGAIHFYWLVKKDIRKPLLFAGVLAVLLAYRGAVWLRTQLETEAIDKRQSVAAE